MGGSYFIARGIARELAVARLQSDFVSAVSHEYRTPLTSLRELWLRPRWSRDGRGLLAGGVDNEGQVGIFRIDPQTGDATLLAPLDTPCCTPGFDGSPDGKMLFYVSGSQPDNLEEHNQIWVMENFLSDREGTAR